MTILFLSDISADFSRNKGSRDKTVRKKGNKIYRAGKWWTPNKPIPANDGKHKKAVLASKKVGGETKYKVVRYGAVGYSDYRKHKDPERRKRFLARHKAIKLKSGLPAFRDKFQSAYWSTNKRGGTW